MKEVNELKREIVRSLKRKIITNSQELSLSLFRAFQFFNNAGSRLDNFQDWEIKVDDIMDVLYCLKELLDQAVEDAEDNIRYAERLERQVEDNEARN